MGRTCDNHIVQFHIAHKFDAGLLTPEIICVNRGMLLTTGIGIVPIKPLIELSNRCGITYGLIVNPTLKFGTDKVVFRPMITWNNRKEFSVTINVCYEH